MAVCNAGLRVLCVCTFWSVCGVVQAAIIPDVALEQARRIEREEAARERARQLEEQRKLLKAPEAEAPKKRFAQPSIDEACIHVSQIEVSGNTLVSDYETDKSKAEFLGQCVGLAQINDILEKITFSYISKGYIASRAYLPEQDLSDGVLEIVLVEGELEEISIRDATSNGALLASVVFPGLVGKPINLRDIEQGIDQLNRLPSNSYKSDVKAGSKPGTSRIIVDGKTNKRWRVSAEIDNLGSESTGQYQSSIGLEFDNPLGLSDQVSAKYQRSMSHHPFYFSKGVPSSDRLQLNYSIPYGYWLVRLSASASQYSSELPGLFAPISTSGHSGSVSLALSKVLHRDQTSKTTLTSSLGWKTQKNYVSGALIELSSRNMTTGGVQLSHARRLAGGSATFTLGYSRGLDLWGTLDDEEGVNTLPRSQFNKLDFSASYVRPFEVAKARFLFESQLSGQWSPDRLYGSEQLSLGGLGSVRGLSYALLSGNNAVLLRNEFTYQAPPVANELWAKQLGAFEPYVAVDWGRVFSQSKLGVEGGDLLGGSIGLRTRGGRVNLDIAWSDILAHPSSVSKKNIDSGIFYARASFTY